MKQFPSTTEGMQVTTSYGGTVKKLVLAVAAAAFLSGAASSPALAQGGGGGQSAEQMQQRFWDALFKGITLSPDQKTKIDAIIEKSRKENPRATTPPANDEERKARMQKAMEVSKKRNAEIRAVLTAEQAKIFDVNVEEMRKNMMGGGAARN